MSTTGGRRNTRSASRAASSRAPSETPSIADEGPANLRSSRAGSARPSGKGKRSNVGNKDTKTYGSKIAALGAERLATAAEDGAVGGIEAALNQTQTQNEQTTGLRQDENLEPVQEESNERSLEPPAQILSRGGELIFRADGEDQSAVEEDTLRSNGNQPLEGFSLLQKQTTLSSSDTSIDRSIFSFFQLKHYCALAAFILVLMLLFADIYRGPLLGGRFDLLKSRLPVGNNTIMAPIGTSTVEDRLTALERLVHQQAGALHAADKPRPINFFSHLHNVLVEYPLTSPTGRIWARSYDGQISLTQPTWFESWIYPRFKKGVVTRNGPAVVFRPWDESDSASWCAAAGEAKLQLGVNVAGPMTPTELVVEYNPYSKQLQPHKIPAPKEIELWMLVLDDHDRESISREVDARYGDSFVPDALTDARSLSDAHIPIGRWTYDFHAPNHVQAFPIDIDLKGAQTKQVVVRVNSNWANDPFTCLYRLRLHGVPAQV
ncbi:MAG: hypothetical protein LQ346_000941 [Caloplaca aetnensis]|nr:MAG: hypothetical protein LQ346_000941 [Caloplaca aetnensis]